MDSHTALKLAYLEHGHDEYVCPNCNKTFLD